MTETETERETMLPIIITGGPGAGKTTLIEALAGRGFNTYPEGSRTLIEQQSQRHDGVLPWTDLPAFADLCLSLMQEQKQAALVHQEVSFMDRAIPDICAYLKQGEVSIQAKFVEASLGYYPTVFFCTPNSEIYVQDEVRPHSFSEALEIDQALKETYYSLGYDVVDVPWGKVAERTEFILSTLGLD